MHARADQLFHELAGESPDDFHVDIISQGDNGPSAETVAQVISSIRQPAFMGGAKTVWLKQFTGFDQEPAGRLEPAKSKSRKKGGDEEDEEKTQEPDPLGLKKLALYLKKNPLPEDIFLILEGADCDPDKNLAKLCRELGSAEFFNTVKLGRKGWQDDVKKCIAEAAARKGITVSYEAREMLVEALGGDTSLIESELEKLAAYMGGLDKPITGEAVREMCPPFHDMESWALREPVGRRQLDAALSIAEQLLSKSKKPEDTARNLIYSLAKRFRGYLAIRLYMAENKLQNGDALKRRMDAMEPSERRTLIATELTIVSSNTWSAKFTADEALRYTPQELIQAIRAIRDSILSLNSGTGAVGLSAKAAAQLVLENTLVKIISTNGGRR